MRDCQGVGDGSAPTMMVTVEGGDGASKSQVYLGEEGSWPREVGGTCLPAIEPRATFHLMQDVLILGKERRASDNLRLSIYYQVVTKYHRLVVPKYTATVGTYYMQVSARQVKVVLSWYLHAINYNLRAPRSWDHYNRIKNDTSDIPIHSFTAKIHPAAVVLMIHSSTLALVRVFILLLQQLPRPATSP